MAFQRLYSVKSQLRKQLGDNYESQSPKHLPFLVVLATPFEAISTLHIHSLHCSLMYFQFFPSTNPNSSGGFMASEDTK